MTKMKCKIHKITLFQGKLEEMFEFDEIWCQLCQTWLNTQTEVIIK